MTTVQVSNSSLQKEGFVDNWSLKTGMKELRLDRSDSNENVVVSVNSK